MCSQPLTSKLLWLEQNTRKFFSISHRIKLFQTVALTPLPREGAEPEFLQQTALSGLLTCCSGGLDLPMIADTPESQPECFPPSVTWNRWDPAGCRVQLGRASLLRAPGPQWELCVGARLARRGGLRTEWMCRSGKNLHLRINSTIFTWYSVHPY